MQVDTGCTLQQPRMGTCSRQCGPGRGEHFRALALQMNAKSQQRRFNGVREEHSRNEQGLLKEKAYHISHCVIHGDPVRVQQHVLPAM